MKQRNPLAVFLLPFVTFGIYSWYWLVKTKGEMNKLGEEIPTAWIWLIPFVGTIWWLWKYSEGVDHVTNEKISGVLAFILIFLLGNIGQAIIQDTFNKTVAVAATPDSATAPGPVDQPQTYTQPDDQTVSLPPAEEAPTEPVVETSEPTPESPVDQPLV